MIENNSGVGHTAEQAVGQQTASGPSTERVVGPSGESVAAADLAIGRSLVRRRILTLLMAEPPTRLHLREIQRRASTSPGTASRELARLVAAGLVEREAEGHRVYFRTATSPFAKMLRALLLGPTATPIQPAEETEASKRQKGAARSKPAARTTPEPAQPLARAPSVDVSAALAAVLSPPVAGEPDPLGLLAAGRLAEMLRADYGDRFRGAYLYGSRAAGQPRLDSDVDVLVVLDRVERYGDELERTSSACAGLTLELGLVVSRVFVSEEDWRERADGQLPIVRAAAVAV